jgi:CheY-like chemotaxis protein
MKFMTVLLIGDSEIEADLFLLAIKRLRIKVDFTSISDEATLSELLSGKLIKPDFIFIDMEMSLLDANACLTMLRGAPGLKNIEIDLYSSMEKNSDIQFMLRHGAKLHLCKSRDFTEFCKDLKRVLSRLL